MKKKLKKDPDQADLKEFLEEYKIQAWDYIIFGDGSGSTAKRSAGWASVSIERATGERLVWHGCANKGTVNFAEIMAYVQPLTYIQNLEADRGKIVVQPIYVHIFTDSEYCANTGNSTRHAQNKNSVLWSVFKILKARGVILKWHWIRRESVALNAYCDKLSRLSRLLIQQYNLQERLLERGELDVNKINP